MRIGLFTAVQWSPEENPAAFLKALREQVRAARDNGFSSLFVGQHLLTGPMGMFQTNPLLGHLVEDAAGMQIGPGVLLLSMMNPVLAAEEAATLDWLSDGNYVLGAGLGYRPKEFQAMGVAKRARVGRLTEGLELIKRLWTEDTVTPPRQILPARQLQSERQAQAEPAAADLARRQRRAGRAQGRADRRCLVHRADLVHQVRAGGPGDVSR